MAELYVEQSTSLTTEPCEAGGPHRAGCVGPGEEKGRWVGREENGLRVHSGKWWRGGGMQEPVLVPVLGLQVALETRCFLPHPAEGL
jgi:hypothetical protein